MGSSAGKPLVVLELHMLMVHHRFKLFHSENSLSAIERYENYTSRVLGVLDSALEGRDRLVGDGCAYADLSYFMWTPCLDYVYHPEESLALKYKNVMAWHDRMDTREAVKNVLAVRQEIMKDSGLGANALPTDWSAKSFPRFTRAANITARFSGAGVINRPRSVNHLKSRSRST